MGVDGLWKALQKENAVRTLDGATKHAELAAEVEGSVVAVDLSAWLMQAQTQPALLEHYDSDYARALKVVFDRTIHWLRYGCLPVFVIEGATPPAKLAKLRSRCVAQFGPAAANFNVGNRAGGQFDRLGQAVRRLLDAFGLPCVQAVGEGEAMCAALNLCGWAHAVHSLDVDALLFGALTVFRQLHLQTDDPRRSQLTVCRRSDVQRLLGLRAGGDTALVAVAQLAGGDYDPGGADNVGEGLALGAVRCLLAGCEDDEGVLGRLEAAIAAGPNPALDALTQCTGCKACGHEGGRKGRITRHTVRHGGCAECGLADGCVAREWADCQCAFHRTSGRRLLNRVVRRALATPGWVSSCRSAAATYQQQLQAAIAEVQRQYGLPVPGSGRNVFAWRSRPDVGSICDMMTRYIKEWDYNQVRLKLLPLLLEWDVRQGPAAGPPGAGGVQFRPVSIRKVSSKGAPDAAGVAARQQQGWRYVLLVERLQQAQPQPKPAAAADSDDDDGDGDEDAAAAVDAEARDLAIDLAWIAGTARSRPPKQAAAGTAAAAAGGGGDGSSQAPDDCLSPGGSLSQAPGPSSQQGGAGSSSQAAAAAAGSGGGGGASGGGRSGGSLQFSEHRSVRCSLMEAVWPELVAAFRNPPASSARAKSAGRNKRTAGVTPHKAGSAAAAAAATAAAGGDKQRTVKDFFGVVKDYGAAAKPLHKGQQGDAAAGGLIPGLAGIAGPSSSSGAGVVAAAAGPAAAGASSRPAAGFRAAGGVAAAAAAGGGGGAGAFGGGGGHSRSSNHAAAAGARQQQQSAGGSSFMSWLTEELELQAAAAAEQQQQPRQAAAAVGETNRLQTQEQSDGDVVVEDGADDDDVILPFSPLPAPPAAAAAAAANTQRLFVGGRSGTSRGASGLQAAGSGRGGSSAGRPARTPSAAGRAGTGSRAASAGARGARAGRGSSSMPAGALERFLQPPTASPIKASQQQQQQQQSRQQPDEGVDDTGCGSSSSPDVPPLAARLAVGRRKTAADAAREAATAAGGGAGCSRPEAGPPSKKVCSPQKAAGDDAAAAEASAAGSAAGAQRPLFQQQRGVGVSAAQQQQRRRPAGMSAAYFVLLQEAGALSPEQQQQADGGAIELLDSPAGADQQQRQRREVDVIDLT